MDIIREICFQDLHFFAAFCDGIVNLTCTLVKPSTGSYAQGRELTSCGFMHMPTWRAEVGSHLLAYTVESLRSPRSNTKTRRLLPHQALLARYQLLGRTSVASLLGQDVCTLGISDSYEIPSLRLVSPSDS